MPKNVNKSCDSWVWLAWFAKKVVRCCQRSLWLDQRQIEIFWSKAVMWLWLEEEIPLAPHYLSLYSSFWLRFQILNKSFRVWKHSRDLMHFKLWFNQRERETERQRDLFTYLSFLWFWMSQDSFPIHIWSPCFLSFECIPKNKTKIKPAWSTITFFDVILTF